MLLSKLKNFKKNSIIALLILAFVGAFALLPASAFAASDPCNPAGKNNSTPSPKDINDCLKANPIVDDLNNIINVLSGLVGIVIIGTLITGGIQYSMAADGSDAVAKAKKRIMSGVIALAAFMFMYAFLQWIVPGGIFNS